MKDKKLFRMCEDCRAKLFLAATHFNLDSVYTRMSIDDSEEKLFAADIVSHRYCINRYLLQYCLLILEDCDDDILTRFIPC